MNRSLESNLSASSELLAARIQREEHELYIEDVVCSERDTKTRIRTVCNTIGILQSV